MTAGYRSWAAVGTFEGYILAVEWRRGYPCPRALDNPAVVRQARAALSGFLQRGREDEMMQVIVKDGAGRSVQFAVFSPDMGAWHPGGGGQRMN